MRQECPDCDWVQNPDEDGVIVYRWRCPKCGTKTKDVSVAVNK